MEFTFETEYNQKAFTMMARALRKTIRKKISIRSHILGWVLVIACLILSVVYFSSYEGEMIAIRLENIITWIALLAVVLALIFEDTLNGYLAKQRMLKGTEKTTAIFTWKNYTTTTAVGTTEWKYSTIHTIAETSNYFIIIFSYNHAQLYDKRTMRGGTPEQFTRFLEQMTKKKMQSL